MARYRITVKMRASASGMLIEKGMSVEMASTSPNLMCGSAGDQLNTIFKCMHGVDLKKMGMLNIGHLLVERIG